MKYVSPIYEVETIETEDIMGASAVAIAESLGINITGKDETTVNNAVTSVTLTHTDAAGNTSDPTEETPANGVSIGINFGSLFGNN